MSLPYDPQEISRLVAGPKPAVMVFDYLRAGLKRDAACGLLTALVYDMPSMRSCRVFSDDLDAYPVGNYKRLMAGPYFEKVVMGKAPFATTGIEGVAELFFDWRKIQELGFESSLNIPAVVDGELIGTANLLASKGTYTPMTVARALRWQPVITLAFLLLTRPGAEGETFHDGLRIAGEGKVEG